MAKIPYDRVRALLEGKGEPRTPTTLSGNRHSIYSYAKRIAWEKDGQWFVVDRQSSPTTNRHINAVSAVLQWSGRSPITVDYYTGQPLEGE